MEEEQAGVRGTKTTGETMDGVDGLHGSALGFRMTANNLQGVLTRLASGPRLSPLDEAEPGKG